MPIPVQKQYFWIPRIWGQDQETGDYALFPAGGWQFVSVPDAGTPEFYNPAPGLGQRSLHLPSWLPDKVYLSGVEAALWTDQPHSAVSELGAWVDPCGHFFHSGNPDGAEPGSNFTDSITLISEAMKVGEQFGHWHRNFTDPILLDRTVGDLLIVKGGFSAGNTGVHIGFRFLVEA